MLALRLPMTLESFLRVKYDEVTSRICERYGISIRQINQGYCWIWAMEFAAQVDGLVHTVDGFGGHAFVEFNRKFYDSESFGEKSWHRMSVFGPDRLTKKNCGETLVLAKGKYLAYWREKGKKIVWEKFAQESLIKI